MKTLVEILKGIATNKEANNHSVGRRGKEWKKEAEIEWQAAARIEHLEVQLRRIRQYAAVHSKNEAVQQIDEFARYGLEGK